MIVIDDFVKDQKLLHYFSDIEVWNNLDAGEYSTYSCVHDKISKPLSTFIWKLKDRFWKYKNWKHFEYWVNITDARQTLDWHEDKNEELAETTGKIVHPQAGAVWYGFPHVVSGGYLEIINEEDIQMDIERIQPVYNRIVVFDVSKTHRVAPILSGTRYGLQVNLW